MIKVELEHKISLNACNRPQITIKYRLSSDSNIKSLWMLVINIIYIVRKPWVSIKFGLDHKTSGYNNTTEASIRTCCPCRTVGDVYYKKKKIYEQYEAYNPLEYNIGTKQTQLYYLLSLILHLLQTWTLIWFLVSYIWVLYS